MRGSDWRSFRRCLAIMTRLLQGPASADQLIATVLEMEGVDAYPTSASAREKAFKRDRESLRQRLGVEFAYSASQRQYHLVDPGDFFSLQFSEADMHALALLSETFSGPVGEHSEVQDFLTALIERLPDNKRRRLETTSPPFNIALHQKIDPNGISARVWKFTSRSVKEGRKFCFNYLSPTYEDGQARYHEVVPVKIQYQWGHWYLRAYRLLRRDLDGTLERKAKHIRFRMSYIQDDASLHLSPALVSAPPAPERHLVHYRLLPPLSRGAISQHFEEMQIQPLPDGSLEITGYTTDTWEAGRILLSYGEFCLVLGGPDVRAWMERTVRGMGQNYPELFE
jgi:hypothetical protein